MGTDVITGPLASDDVIYLGISVPDSSMTYAQRLDTSLNSISRLDAARVTDFAFDAEYAYSSSALAYGFPPGRLRAHSKCAGTTLNLYVGDVTATAYGAGFVYYVTGTTLRRRPALSPSGTDIPSVCGGAG